MLRFFLYTVIACIFITVTGCYSPEPVLRLTSEDPGKVFVMGTEYIKIEKDGIEAIAAFIEEYNYMVLFDISIANYTDSVVRVQPESFYFMEEGKTEYALRGITTPAYDPEQKLLEYDMLGRKEDARYASKQTGSTIMAIFDFATDIASIGEEKTEEDIENEAAETEDLLAKIETDNIEHENAKVILQGDMKQWSVDALRKTDLPPGYAIRGIVYFPARYYAKSITLCLPVAGRIIKYTYSQKKH